LPTALPALAFVYATTPFEIENTGHVVEVPYAEGAATLRIGFDAYALVQFHFHTPSEHTIDGGHGEMEVHLVHRNTVGDLAVVGVILRVGANPNPLIEQILANAPSATGAVELEGEVNATSLLPVSAGASYWTYSGSLTTPPCTEGVRWLVAKEPVNVSAAAVANLRRIVSQFPGYGGSGDNNRPVRPLDGRVVLSK
jgi:carbonic anhydrase